MAPRRKEEDMLKTKFFTSLDRVFPEQDWEETERVAGTGTMLANERFSFQLGYRFDGAPIRMRVELAPDCCGISVRRVGRVPAEYVRPAGADGNYERTLPGMFPDPLLPLEEGNRLRACADGANALWITVEGEELAGENFSAQERLFPLKIRLFGEEPEGERLMAEAEYEITLLPHRLPVQKTVFTQWFHGDCLALWYGIVPLSEEWWMRAEQYISCAVRNGVNMILTPVFTPPLDTPIGKERLTVQLVDVERSGDFADPWRFGFDNLKRWIRTCEKCGIRYFEISHLFSQWGAAYAPKIEAKAGEKRERVFGWETRADDAAYTDFLNAFLPRLVSFLKGEGVWERCFFHVSDEPSADQLNSYRKANETVREHIGDRPIMDAISDLSFYENGLIDLPVCASDHIDPFLKKRVRPLFAYYCCAQGRRVSNRFLGMPSVRNRCIGIQLYWNRVEGFLHWGYNYWLTPGSVGLLDPYAVTDCDRTFPAGDAFSVYPGAQGPVESIRQVVFYEAMQDARLLALLEQRKGRAAVEKLLEDWNWKGFADCPDEPADFWRLRERLLEDLHKSFTLSSSVFFEKEVDNK